ncbi:MAG: MBOAT family protein [Bacteroidales bacterium]|nr:MBOAT family protein [Bacteroidales bacterium]
MHVILLVATTLLTYFFGNVIASSEKSKKFSQLVYNRSRGLMRFILTMINTLSGRTILTNSELQRKLCLAIGLLPGLGALAYFKYTNFFITNLNQIIEDNFPILDIALPVGISFYTFQSISYLIDIYRRKIDPADNILDFAFYLVFFPQLVAGPIVKANHFLPQLKQERNITSESVYQGLWMIIIGLVKKGVIADYIAQYNDLIFAAPQNYNGFENLMAVFGYALQIFCDFSGYSDMAIGIGRVMGYDLGINFNSPYKSKSVSEFWKRWHISLSTWLQEYLYIPLGGNRTFSKFSLFSIPAILLLTVAIEDGTSQNLIIALAISALGITAYYTGRNVFVCLTLLAATIMSVLWFNTCTVAAIMLIVGIALWLIALAFPSAVRQIQTDINLLLTMLIGGLWHGASWKFVFWGGVHGVALGIDKLIKKVLPQNRVTNTVMWFFTFALVVFLWMFFRANDISIENVLDDGTTSTEVIGSFQVPFLMLSQIFGNFDLGYFVHFWDARYIWVIMVVLGFAFHAVPESLSIKTRDIFVKSPFILKIIILLIVCQLVIQFKNETVQPFIYFDF